MSTEKLLAGAIAGHKQDYLVNQILVSVGRLAIKPCAEIRVVYESE